MLVPGVGRSRVPPRYAGFAPTTPSERELVLVLVLVPGAGKSRAPRYAGFAPTTPSERALLSVVGIGESPGRPCRCAYSRIELSRTTVPFFLSAKDAKDAKKARDAKEAGASRAAGALHGDGHSDTCLRSCLRPWRPLRTKTVLHQQLEIFSVRARCRGLPVLLQPTPTPTPALSQRLADGRAIETARLQEAGATGPFGVVGR